MDSPVEGSLPVFSEGAKPDVLFRLGAFRVAVVSSPALGGSDTDPARCIVDGAGMESERGWSGREALVTMMQTADLGQGNDRSGPGRLNGSTIRCVLAGRQVGP